MFAGDHPLEVAHFFDIPAVVVGLAKRDQLLGEGISLWGKEFELDVFFEESEFLVVYL